MGEKLKAIVAITNRAPPIQTSPIAEANRNRHDNATAHRIAITVTPANIPVISVLGPDPKWIHQAIAISRTLHPKQPAYFQEVGCVGSATCFSGKLLIARMSAIIES